MKVENTNQSEIPKFEEKKLNLSNFMMVQKVCGLALENSKFFAIIGEPGSGKSVALQHFKQKRPNVVKLLSVQATMGIGDFFQELGILFDYRGGSKSKFVISRHIKEYCNSIDEPELLLIDEAARFKPHQFTYLQEIRDISKGSLGIVISGPHDFLIKLLKWDKNGTMGVAEFKRRVQMFVKMRKLDVKEKIAVCKEYGINEGKLIQETFLKYNNIGALTTSIENHLKYKKELEKI